MRLLILPLILGLCAPDETVSGYAEPDAVYGLETLGGEAVGYEAHIAFPEKGRVQGAGPCNIFSASQSVPYPWIEIGPIAATKRACPDLAGEAAFFAALEAAELVEVAGDVLILTDGAGAEAVFRRR
ncbi:MAG: META domain-containing protein [Pseudomonadota bacterium]